MTNVIRCPKCGSTDIASVLYGFPAFDEELRRKIDAGDVVLNGCEIESGVPLYPHECKACGLRFDGEAARHPSAREFFSEEDYAFLENLALFYESDDEGVEYVAFTDDDELAGDCADMAQSLLNNDPETFEEELEYGYPMAHRRYADPTFAKLVVMGLEYGVACEDGACANWLGAMYYAGEVVEQDYTRAKELYELAEKQGVVQAMINLGYIYEYGRTSEPDHTRAYMQYAKVAAMHQASEALYKLGDMYSRGKVVERDMRTAYNLYRNSLENAHNNEMRAQAAIRIANLVSDRENAQWGIRYDPMQALELYQLAERGLRKDIAHGQTYYTKRLEEAIEGQEEMRRVLESEPWRL